MEIKDFGYQGMNLPTYQRDGADIYYKDSANVLYGHGRRAIPLSPSTLFDDTFYKVGYSYSTYETSLSESE